MEYISERITIDEKICDGKPTIKETRITVQSILDFLSAGETQEEILSILQSWKLKIDMNHYVLQPIYWAEIILLNLLPDAIIYF